MAINVLLAPRLSGGVARAGKGYQAVLFHVYSFESKMHFQIYVNLYSYILQLETAYAILCSSKEL